MKNLKQLVQKARKERGFGFPIQGQDGYGGEQDGTYVVFLGVFSIQALKIMKNIEVGDAIGVHWADYHAGEGWKISLAHWSDASEEDTDISQVEKYRGC